MPDSNLNFQPLTDRNREEAGPFIREKQPDITPEILGLLKGVIATSEDQGVIAAGLINRWPVNHPLKWCHGVSLNFQDEATKESWQGELLVQTANHVIEDVGQGLLVGFSRVSAEQKSEYPESLFTAAGFKLLDCSLDYRGPVPFTQSPEYAYRRSHQDKLFRFNPEQTEDLDALVAFANKIYDGILPNPRRRPERWLEMLKTGISHLVYAKSPDGAITGLIEIICEKPPMAYVGDIMVSYRRMGTGLAIELSRMLEKIVMELGASELSCHVADWNRASQKLIESFGLTPRGGLKRYLREFGTPEASKA